MAGLRAGPGHRRRPWRQLLLWRHSDNRDGCRASPRNAADCGTAATLRRLRASGVKPTVLAWAACRAEEALGPAQRNFVGWLGAAGRPARP